MTGKSVVTSMEKTYYHKNHYYLIIKDIQQLFISRKPIATPLSPSRITFRFTIKRGSQPALPDIESD